MSIKLIGDFDFVIRGSVSVCSLVRIQIFHISRHVFARVISIDWRGFPDKNESKHDVVRTIRRRFFCDELIVGRK